MSPETVSALVANLLSPAVLFFLLGIVATLSRSDLKFPEPLYVTLTIYLLVAIGFKGGAAISKAGLAVVWKPTLLAVLLGGLIPLGVYPVLRFLGRFPAVDAAAISAHYGSVSAVTFIAATNYLKQIQLPYQEYASAFLAVMEAPAIILGVVLGRLGGSARASIIPTLRKAVHEAVFGRSVVLLVGSMLIGWASGSKGAEMTAGFLVSPFQGVLCLFLLEMGMVAARRFGDLRKVGGFLVVFGVAAPLAHGALGVLCARWMGLDTGTTVLLATLAASASYIAAPAAMRMSLPEANPTFYLTAALGVTFPFNLTLGLPLYLEMARRWNPSTP
jgi:hypothetical protein